MPESFDLDSENSFDSNTSYLNISVEPAEPLDLVAEIPFITIDTETGNYFLYITRYISCSNKNSLSCKHGAIFFLNLCSIAGRNRTWVLAGSTYYWDVNDGDSFQCDIKSSEDKDLVSDQQRAD
jgi:hypothetical protein